MTKKEILSPQHIFEVSWEVCNRVGGIYAVLSTRAKSMVDAYGKKNVVFIGPDIWTEAPSPWFIENNDLFVDWKNHSKDEYGIDLRVGTWDVPGSPLVVLIKFDYFFSKKDAIYGHMWEKFKVDSLNAYGDYDESCMFAYASGMVIESYYSFFKLNKKRVVAHFNEWTVGMGALYVKEKLPQIATLFTTHATTVGRSIAGNNKALYDHLYEYNGDQMAQELNIAAKHSVEKQAALAVDCFTTVSQITANECSQFLGRTPIVTPNGFEQDFVPSGRKYTTKRKEARKALIDITNALYGTQLSDNAILIGTSGRYEYRNKGIDVYIDSLNRLNQRDDIKKDIVAFIMVPAWVKESRVDLKERLKSNESFNTPLDQPCITHWLNEMDSDPVLNHARFLSLDNPTNKVKLVFIPSYLNGNDGILNLSYYDLLIGLDTTVFPSYYEPWGYTPHESIAFSVPTITTFLAGFGIWASQMDNTEGMGDAIEVIHRGDHNFSEVSEKISDMITQVAKMSKKELQSIRNIASEKSKFGDWEHFFRHYEEAYSLALETNSTRVRIKK